MMSVPKKAQCLLSLGLLALFLLRTDAVRAAAGQALALCVSSVIPALLPFLVVSDLLLSLGFAQWAERLLAPFMALYRLPGCAASALLLGLLGGYPAGARAAVRLHRQGQLTAEQAGRLLAFCNNSNPVFLISVVGAGTFGSFSIGALLWLIHLASALAVGLLFRQTGSSKRCQAESPASASAFFPALAHALAAAGGTLVSICTCVIFFYVLLTPLRSCPGPAASFLIALTELFSLSARLQADRLSLVLASLAVGWGGLSVLCQTGAVLEGSGLSLRPLLVGKVLHGLLAALLTDLCSPLLLG